ncbi:uncharacterized protein LOC143421408 [Maylandia zebra]|uniref:uncharacterized protein LOC143421408 n=1 Tax=Maylandia zebra TaxID=106582 RepID=UPI00403C9D46
MNPHTQQNKTRLLKTITAFLLLPLLTFGIVSCTIFTKSKQEVSSLRQQMTEVHPVADTLPNFTSESQGAMILIDVSSWTYLPRENSAKWWLCKFMQWVDPTRAKRRVIQMEETVAVDT